MQLPHRFGMAGWCRDLVSGMCGPPRAPPPHILLTAGQRYVTPTILPVCVSRPCANPDTYLQNSWDHVLLTAGQRYVRAPVRKPPHTYLQTPPLAAGEPHNVTCHWSCLEHVRKITEENNGSRDAPTTA